MSVPNRENCKKGQSEECPFYYELRGRPDAVPFCCTRISAIHNRAVGLLCPYYTPKPVEETTYEIWQDDDGFTCIPYNYTEKDRVIGGNAKMLHFFRASGYEEASKYYHNYLFGFPHGRVFTHTEPKELQR